jgi:predicted transcriptional regulator
MLNPAISITPTILNLIAKIDEFKGEWKAIGNLAPEYEPWILFFLSALKSQKEVLTRKIEKEKLFIKLPRLSRRIIELVWDHGELSISEIETITKANRNSLKNKLSELVKNKHLLTHGRGKGT